jgi:hypothetical protein
MARYEMVYRCECGWVTTHYDEIDGHENQLEPGHLVQGQIEDTSAMSL